MKSFVYGHSRVRELLPAIANEAKEANTPLTLELL